MEKYIVKIIQGNSIVTFRFNEQADAVEFINICIETADDGTKAQIERVD